MMSTFKRKTFLIYIELVYIKMGVSAARLIRILFSNLNISIKHRKIGEESVRFGLHKRFSITVGCMISTVH